MSLIKVFTGEEALAAIRTAPQRVFTIRKRQGEAKTYKGGAYFLDSKFNIQPDMDSKPISMDGWFSIRNVMLTRDIADPSNKDDKRNEFEGSRLVVQSTVSRLRAFGEFLRELHPVWISTIESLVEDKTIKMGQRAIHGIICDSYGPDHKTKANEPIEDPLVNFKLNFNICSPQHPNKLLAGKPNTEIYDYNTEYVDENGITQYKLAMVEDDDGNMVPVNDKNVHKFVTNNSEVMRGRIHISSCCVSASWISLSMMANKLVIKPGCTAGFSDELPNDDQMKALKETLKAPAVPAVEPVVEAVQAAPAEPSNDADVDDILNNI